MESPDSFWTFERNNSSNLQETWFPDNFSWHCSLSCCEFKDRKLRQRLPLLTESGISKMLSSRDLIRWIGSFSLFLERVRRSPRVHSVRKEHDWLCVARGAFVRVYSPTHALPQRHRVSLAGSLEGSAGIGDGGKAGGHSDRPSFPLLVRNKERRGVCPSASIARVSLSNAGCRWPYSVLVMESN